MRFANVSVILQVIKDLAKELFLEIIQEMCVGMSRDIVENYRNYLLSTQTISDQLLLFFTDTMTRFGTKMFFCSHLHHFMAFYSFRLKLGINCGNVIILINPVLCFSQRVVWWSSSRNWKCWKGKKENEGRILRWNQPEYSGRNPVRNNSSTFSSSRSWSLRVSSHSFMHFKEGFLPCLLQSRCIQGIVWSVSSQFFSIEQLEFLLFKFSKFQILKTNSSGSS